jgi:catechol 2,3-dioxygenase-like lactoylglutathione lyase family enzyme
MTLSVHATIPILRIFDLAKAKEFYVDFMGFKVDWEHRFDDVAPIYMQVSRDGLVVHLSEHYGDACPGSTIYISVSRIAEFHRELTQKQYGYLRPGLGDSGWGSKCMEVIDPFGNRLRFDEKLDESQ